MRSSKAVIWLSFLICLLALIAAGTGLFWRLPRRGPALFTFAGGAVTANR
jgi:hypothetical protein